MTTTRPFTAEGPQGIAGLSRRLQYRLHAQCSTRAGRTWNFVLSLWMGLMGFSSPPLAASDSPSGSRTPHWSIQPVVRPTPPSIPGAAADVLHPVDAFIRSRMLESGLAPSPEADRRTLIRRLYLVMLGLVPTPAEVDAFLADSSPRAFETWVDRVLSDPRYGERWGRHWLDVVRFAESNGFETNRERLNAWKFRDYVIQAFNHDKPYDQFVREQIAGDALGEDLATGFLVGGPVDIVGSPDPVLTAQQRADEIDDMVNTTGTAFLGLTLGCARCHTHKFDPIEHREYYGMAALFAGVRHGERALPLPSRDREEVEQLNARIVQLEGRLSKYTNPPPSRGSVPSAPGVLRPPVQARWNEEKFVPLVARSVRFTILESSSGEPCIDELEVWSGERNVALAAHGTRPSASGTLPGYEIHKLEHINDGQTGNGRSWISNEPGRGWVRLDFAAPHPIDRIVWARDREGRITDRLATRYLIEAAAGSNQWVKVADSADRKPYEGSGNQPSGPAYQFDAWPEEEAGRGREGLRELEGLRRKRDQLRKAPMAYGGTFVQPGPTHRLHRGDPMQKREAIAPGTLGLFRPLTLDPQTSEQERRLQLARWITHPENPLTARVMVNRIWQHHFGVGLVETSNDFGKNGVRPSHPELLDWLASEFMTRGWSVKSIQRMILLSTTWRQSSAPRPAASAVDAGNRLLWRFPPRRLEAEAIRDNILAVSGNLDPSMGGPGFYLHEVDRENVYHYHPREKFTAAETRRMVYAFKVRMEQDGIFGSFDCPDGSLVTPRRSVSTTPLQALNLFNSGFVQSQSGILAARLEREAGSQTAAQVAHAWRIAFGRPASPEELAEASEFVDQRGLAALSRAILNANELLFIP